MARILVSGLVNVETTVKVRKFPIDYYPIDYPFFGVQSHVSGVAMNIAAAARKLGDEVVLSSMTGQDFQAEYIRRELSSLGVDCSGIRDVLRQTPSSVILYDDTGRRQVYCDLKDIQETAYPLTAGMLDGVDLVVCCNINFNRPLLHAAKAAGKRIATDVHVLGNIHDEYNREFMECADSLFLSDEAAGEDYRGFLKKLYRTYGNEIIVMGRGGKGAALCWQGSIYEIPAVQVGPVVNTVGAGDSLFTSFHHFVASGYNPVEALIRAQIFASAKIGANGGAQGFISEDRVQEFYLQFAEGMKQKMQVFPF